METNNKENKVYLNVVVAPRVKKSLEDHAEVEDRTVSKMCDRLLGWSVKWLEQAGNSETLLSYQAGPSRKTGRVSEELQDQLHGALDLIFDRAPSTVIDAVTKYLTERAGRYGSPK